MRATVELLRVERNDGVAVLVKATTSRPVTDISPIVFP